jgi:hypothetical protein
MFVVEEEKEAYEVVRCRRRRRRRKGKEKERGERENQPAAAANRKGAKTKRRSEGVKKC